MYYGALWPLTAVQACYLLGRDGHINSILFPYHSYFQQRSDGNKKLQASGDERDQSVVA